MCLRLDTSDHQYGIEVDSYLGRSADVQYFWVKIHDLSSENPDLSTKGLLRLGMIDGALSRELQLRQPLRSHKMLPPLVASSFLEKVIVSSLEILQEILEPENLVITANQNEFEDNVISILEDEKSRDSEDAIAIETTESSEDEYLEEDIAEQIISIELPESKLVLLSYFPDHEISLEDWLQTASDRNLETSLSIIIQICQLFNYIHKQGWSFAQINPKLICISTPVQFFDLTGVYKLGEKLSSGLSGAYCAPELSFSNPIDERMGSYIIGTLLYQVIHGKLPVAENLADIQPTPGIYQILHICLADINQRFPLSQLLSTLVEIQQRYRTPQIQWYSAGRSTVGLSLSRIQNEDTYGVRQQYISDRSMILGAIADGMGGMADGEVASQLAIKTVLESTLPENLKTPQQQEEWLVSLVQTANDLVVKSVKDGGTTLSIISAIAQDLAIAHVGDSRIFLVRNGQICQLSEDHSMVAMLLATEQITYEESQNHRDRNILTKSIGSKRNIGSDYVQGLALTLKHGDILLLCSDGVWDLVPADELAEIFTDFPNLSTAVDQTINLVLNRGAHDNATILALGCSIQNNY
jgi:PPM family protein phosphatase